MRIAVLIARIHAGLMAVLCACLVLAGVFFVDINWLETLRALGFMALVAVPLLIASVVLLYVGVLSILRSDAHARKYGLVQAATLALFLIFTVLMYFLLRADGLRGREAWLDAMVIPAFGPVLVPPIYLFAMGLGTIFERLKIGSLLTARYPSLRHFGWACSTTIRTTG